MKIRKMITILIVILIFFQIMPVAFADEINANLMNVKVTLNGSNTSIKAYNIDGKGYVSLASLYLTFQSIGNDKNFNEDIFIRDQDGIKMFRELKAPKDMPAKAKAYETKSTLVYLKDSKASLEGNNKIELIPNCKGYEIDNVLYYPLVDMMKYLDCGLIFDKKTGNMNMDTKKYYEAPFAPIAKGSAEYMKLQKKLYDIYFEQDANKGGVELGSNGMPSNVTVPDGATLYIPAGVSIDTGGSDKIFLGNNSTFYVRGSWKVEYPDRHLKALNKTVKNAVYVSENNNNYSFNGKPEMVSVDSSRGGFDYSEIDMPLKTAEISYTTNSDGIDDIFINFTRNKNDPKKDLVLLLIERDGTAHQIILEDVYDKVKITDAVAKIIAKSSGKNTTFTKMLVHNYDLLVYDYKDMLLEQNENPFPDSIIIPINWTVETTLSVPEVDSNYRSVVSINYKSEKPLIINRYKNLSNTLFIAKLDTNYKGPFDDDYRVKYDLANANYELLRPSQKHTLVRPIRENGMDYVDERLAAYSNIAAFNGKKGTEKNSYGFKISPFSKTILHNTEEVFTLETNVVEEGGKTYLSLYNKSPNITSRMYDNIQIAESIKKSKNEELKWLTVDQILFEKGRAKLDITKLLNSEDYEEPILYIFNSRLVSAMSQKTIPSESYIELDLKTLKCELKDTNFNKKTTPLEIVKPIETAKTSGKEFTYHEVVFDNDSGVRFDLKTGQIIEYIGSSSKVVIPSSIRGVEVSSIGFMAFNNREDVKSVVLPNTIKRIEQQAFLSCKNLKSINLPNGLKYIGAFAFAGTDELESLDIPDSVNTIEMAAFSYCGIKKIKLSKNLTEIAERLFNNAFNLTSITIPEGVKRIGDISFDSCGKLKTISIPSSVKEIGNSAFTLTPWQESLPSTFLVNGIDPRIGGIVKNPKAVIPDGNRYRLEAEDGKLIGATKTEKDAKFSNGKYLSYFEGVEFTKIPKTYGFSIKYARQGGNGKLKLYINNVLKETITLADTKGWAVFDESELMVDIPEGATIKFIAEQSTTVNIDYIELFTTNKLEKKKPIVIPASQKFKIEGEDGILTGSTAVFKEPAASNGKHVGNLYELEFKNLPKSSGLNIQYSRWEIGSGYTEFYINNVFKETLIFSNTGGWNKFENFELMMDIPEGATLKFKTVIERGKDGWYKPINIDYIELYKVK